MSGTKSQDRDPLLAAVMAGVRMREHQKRFFKARQGSDERRQAMADSVAAEKEFDRLAAAIVSGQSNLAV
jgi:hypothetical protein